MILEKLSNKVNPKKNIQIHLESRNRQVANVNTIGFKADRARFMPLMYQNYLGIDNEQLPMGVGTRVMMTSTDFSQGGVADNGRLLDYMIEGDGFSPLPIWRPAR